MGRSTWNARELPSLVEQFDLVDSWTAFHWSAFQATWCHGESASRLDLFCLPINLAPLVSACTVVPMPAPPFYISYHPAFVTLRMTATGAPQTCVWRVEAYMLYDPTDKAKLHRNIPQPLVRKERRAIALLRPTQRKVALLVHCGSAVLPLPSLSQAP